MNFIALSVPVFFLLIFAELIYARVTGKELYHFGDTLTNLSCGIGQQVVGLWLKVYAVWWLFFFYQFRLFTIPANWVTTLLLFLGVDFCYYWFHRLSHEINAIWATHVVHHQSEEYNLSVALRQSWFQSVFSSLFYIPLALVGFHPEQIGIIIAINTLYQFWIHTRAIGKMPRIVEYIFNTPSHHRVHHGTNPAYIDRNHAGSLIIWDRMFGTFQAEEEEVVYGITTPLQSYNPVWANFHYWKELLTILRKPGSMADKIQVLVRPPGWFPAAQGGYHPPSEPDPHYQKFRPVIPRKLSVYLLVQYVFIVLITSYIMFFGKTVFDKEATFLQTAFSMYVALYVLISVTSIGALLQLRRYSLYLEYIRICLLAGAGLWFIHSPLFYPALVLLLIVSLFSWIHFSTLALVKQPPIS